ncbi:antitoxin [Streptomyces sp. NRRL S-350]|uniref:antitoxin n=1 Tax=Streptomyces sp. NRRL S-350 TaxID=1463902 RepID=UPI0004C2A58E|nr:antitoxin [Streptomyces sp. NRRL S-350]
MGLMDNLKGKAEELKEKAGELAGKHSDQIDTIVDKAGGAIDKATKGKYSDRIEHGAAKAKDAVGDFAHKPKPDHEGPAGGNGPTPRP